VTGEGGRTLVCCADGCVGPSSVGSRVRSRVGSFGAAVVAASVTAGALTAAAFATASFATTSFGAASVASAALAAASFATTSFDAALVAACGNWGDESGGRAPFASEHSESRERSRAKLASTSWVRRVASEEAERAAADSSSTW